MCGRFTNRFTWRELYELYELYSLTDQDMASSNLQPKFNIAPTQTVPVVRSNHSVRQLAMMRWGLVPSFAKDLSAGSKCFNARAETVAEKPTFKRAFRQRRCLVPADGFYEWKAEGKAKQPYFITLKERAPFAFAGLWESWRPNDKSNEVETFTIITTAPNAIVAPLHNRMPVILAREDWPLWLNEEPDSANPVRALLRPFPDAQMTCWPVSRAVNQVANDTPELVEPI
jgi:putative SOS response-associated peptidase YedK